MRYYRWAGLRLVGFGICLGDKWSEGEVLEGGERGPHGCLVHELMQEAGVHALPCNIKLLGRAKY